MWSNFNWKFWTWPYFSALTLALGLGGGFATSYYGYPPTPQLVEGGDMVIMMEEKNFLDLRGDIQALRENNDILTDNFNELVRVLNLEKKEVPPKIKIGN